MPLAATVAGILLLVSAYSKTYKDFQQRFFPAFVLTLLPGLAAVLPGVELRSAIVMVPIANLSVAVREILVGKIDWLMLPLAFLVSAGAAVFLLRRAMEALSAERLVTAAESDEADFRGGPALFPRHVLSDLRGDVGAALPQQRQHPLAGRIDRAPARLQLRRDLPRRLVLRDQALPPRRGAKPSPCGRSSRSPGWPS